MWELTFDDWLICFVLVINKVITHIQVFKVRRLVWELTFDDWLICFVLVINKVITHIQVL